jgi:predicted N-acetyltransferase YhbS
VTTHDRAGRPAGVVVRDATRADAERIAELLAQLGYPSTAGQVTRRLGALARLESNVVLVAEDDARVVGLVTGVTRDVIHRDEPFCRIASMIVDEEWRERGVGRRLVDAIEQWARDRGCSVIEVSSGVQRLGAHRFYEGLGYVEKPKRYIKDL